MSATNNTNNTNTPTPQPKHSNSPSSLKKSPGKDRQHNNSVNKENPRTLKDIQNRLPTDILEYIGYCKNQSLSRNSICIPASSAEIQAHKSFVEVEITQNNILG